MLFLENLWKKKELHIFLYALLLGALAITFQDVLLSIFDSWQKEEYSYAYLVAPLACLLILHKMARKPKRLIASYLGIPVLALGLGVHVLGLLTGLTIVPQYGFFLALMGLALTFFGREYFLYLLPALAYLFFAIPLPTTLYVTASAKLQLLSSSLGTQLLQILGYSVFQEGNIIDLGNFKLQVIEACSGLRYIFPLLGFSYLIALFYKAAFWKRTLVFVSALPLAVFMNVFRIAATGMAINIWGKGIAEGFLHYFEGWIVFSLCLFLLYLEIKLLCLLSRKKEEINFDMLSMPKPPFTLCFTAWQKPSLLALALLVLIAGLQEGQILAPAQATIPARNLFIAYPDQLGNWRGKRNALSRDELALLRPSDYLLSKYQKEKTLPFVDFFIAYYDTQVGKSNLHSPEMCLPGSGWQTLSQKVFPIFLPKEKPFYVNRVVIQKGNKKQLVYYWFEQAGKDFASRYAIKWHTLWNALTRGRTESALFRVITPLEDGEEIEAADQRLQDFLQEARPSLKSYIPGY